MKHTVTLNSVVVATSDQASTDLAGKKAILQVTRRTYYTLDEVASPIWDQIQQEQRVEDLLKVFLNRYDVEPMRGQQDLVAFLQTLADQDLIEVR